MGWKLGIVSRWQLCACTCMAILATAFVGSGQVAGAAGTKAGGSPINIQIDVPYNLPVASQPESIAAAQAAVDAINKNGGVNGHKLSLSVCNTDLNPSSSVACITKAISSHVAATVGDFDFPADSQDFTLLNNAKIPAIGPLVADAPPATSPASFPLNGSTLEEYAGAGYALKAIPGVKTVAIAENPVPNYIQQGITKAGLKFAGPPVTLPQSVTDYSSYAASLKATGADAVVAETSFGQFQPLVTAAAQLQYYPKWVTVAPNVQQNEISSDLAPLGSKVVDNVIVMAALVPYGETSNAGIRQFQGELAAAKAKGVANAGAGLVDEFALGAWLSVHTFANVAKHIHGPITGASMTTALDHTKALNMYGLMPAWTPSTVGLKKFPRVSNPDLYAAHITNGDKVTLLSTKTISLAHFPFSETNG
jgi:ABC-type branched-subunit amino acid transport system substrate-binding protein